MAWCRPALVVTNGAGGVGALVPASGNVCGAAALGASISLWGALGAAARSFGAAPAVGSAASNLGGAALATSAFEASALGGPACHSWASVLAAERKAAGVLSVCSAAVLVGFSACDVLFLSG